MTYQPLTGVWEITMGCNMRCMHCGSICENPLEDELTTEEAVDLCVQIGELGLEWITLSGGEPFTRKDWPKIVSTLNENNVLVNMITNGWQLDEPTLQKAKESGVSTIAISVDGTKEVHDEIRKEGSFERLSNAFEIMSDLDITSGAVTTVSTMNIDILDEIKAFLVDKKVKYWQLQLGLPMGTMAKNNDMILKPKDIDRILDFIHKNTDKDVIKIYPADCIGYYTKREIEIRQSIFETDTMEYWTGCHAGKRSFGILQNGDILGCTSIRDKTFIEGNIRERSLREIWEDDTTFLWSRTMEKEKLEGNCLICDYDEVCKGGCPNTRLTMSGSIYGENKYCAYNYALDKTADLIDRNMEVDELFDHAEYYMRIGDLTMAYLVLDSLIPRKKDIITLSHMGYVSFMLGDYKTSKSVNQEIIRRDPENSYALKGLGLAIYRLEEDVEQAITMMKKAMSLDSTPDLDTYLDLATVYYELGQKEEALAIIESGNNKSQLFKSNAYDLYKRLLSEATTIS